MISAEAGRNPADTLLYDTLRRVPADHWALFGQGERAAAELPVTLISPEGMITGRTTVQELADRSAAERESHQAASNAHTSLTDRKSPSAAALGKLNDFFAAKDIVEGCPREGLLRAARALLSARALDASADLSPDTKAPNNTPALVLTNAQTRQSTTIELDLAALITQNERTLEETKAAFQLPNGDECGERKVWLRLEPLFGQYATEIGVDLDNSTVKEGDTEWLGLTAVRASISLATISPLTSEWWRVCLGTAYSGHHFSYPSPVSALQQWQHSFSTHIAGLQHRRHTPSRSEDQHVLSFSFTPLQPFEQSFNQLRGTVEAQGLQLALLAASAEGRPGSTFATVTPFPVGQSYGQLVDINQDLRPATLAAHDDLRIALKRAIARVFGA